VANQWRQRTRAAANQRTSDGGGVGCRTSDGGGVGCREREERNGDCGGEKEKEKKGKHIG